MAGAQRLAAPRSLRTDLGPRTCQRIFQESAISFAVLLLQINHGPG